MKRRLDEEMRNDSGPSKKVALERQSWVDCECTNAVCGRLKLEYIYEKRLLNTQLQALKKQSELEKWLIQASTQKQILEADQEVIKVRQQLREAQRRLAMVTKSDDVQLKLEKDFELGKSDSSTGVSHQFTWLRKRSFEVPTALLLNIATFLSDDTLFRFREINTTFYGTFYNQRVERDLLSRFPWRTTRPFNAMRALKLALQGRRFPRVRFIKTDHAERTSDTIPSEIHLSALTPICFPNLDSIYLGQLKRNNSVKYLPGHARVEAISTPIYFSKESHYINPEKFPNLRLLEMQSVTCEATVRRHLNLEYINFFDCYRVRWDGMNKENFPSLKKITKKYSGRIPSDVVFHLEASGVAVEEVEVEL